MGRKLTCEELSIKYPVPELSEFIRWEKPGRDWCMVISCTKCGKERRLTTQALGNNVGCQCQWHHKMTAVMESKYGCTHYTQHAEFSAKHKDTIANQSPEEKQAAIKRRELTMQERYGAKYPTQIKATMDVIKRKAATTCLERYGDVCSMRNAVVKAKRVATCRQRYGHDYASQNEAVLEKMLISRNVSDRQIGFRSGDELELEAFIQSLGLDTKHHASGAREVDVLIPSRNVGIEYNGLFWHSEGKNRNRAYHLEKKLCLEAEGIKLIQIWSDLWLHRKEQVQNFLRAKLGCCTNRVGVRKCSVREVSTKEARAFVEAHHIQGSPSNITLAIGAYVEDCLTAIATFAPHHRGHRDSDGNIQMTLNRLCTKPDWVVSGFLGKAARMAFSAIRSPIVTWVDRMWSDGDSYLLAGFKMDKVLPPDYCYTKGKTRVPKQSFRKIDARTEIQRATDEKMYRLWDCGKIRFIFRG